MRREQLFAKALVLVSLVFFCSSCHGYNSSQPLLPLTNLSVQLAQPTRVTQFVLTPITVALNGSICKHMGQAAVGSEVQLVLQAAAADGRDLAVRSGSISSNCSSLVFPVFLNASARAGSFQARIVLIKQQRSLQLPGNIAVVVPPVLSVKSRTLNVSADQSAFAVGVQLSEPAAAQGVSVRMQLTDEDAARVYKGSLAWPAGSSGLQSFWLSLQSVPSSGRLLVQLVQPQGAVLDPAAAEAEVLVQSPVVSFKSGLGYYRGINTSTPQLHFTVSGVSAFPSEFTFSTFLLPGSRPSAVPCHPLASACSVADLEAVDNVTLTGTRWLSPGQQQLQPVDLPINWGRLPPEAELRVGVRIVSRTNVRVAQQQGQVAAIVFGTPPGHCPPGSALLSDTGSHNSSRDGPTYTNVAALQDLGLALFPETESSSNSSRKNGSGTSNSSSAPAMPNDGSSSTRSLLEGSGCSSNSSTNCSQPGHAGNAAGAAAAAITMDLDPPFRPMVDRYIALLPPKPSGTGKLLLASSRWGDVVVVDATACDGLDSSRYQVVWGKQQRMWRQRYSLAGQNSSCWLRVHVFTKTDAPGSYAHSSGGSSSIYDSSPDEDDSTNSSSNGGGGGDGNGDGSTYSSNKTSSSMWALPQDFVLYRSYTIRFIPLRPPEQLSLRSISFSNSGTTVIACGVPRVLSHLFQAAPPTLLSSVMSMAGAAGIGSSSGNESSSVAAAAFTGAAAAVAMGGFVPVSSAAGSRSSAAAGHVAAAEAGRYLPRPLVAAPGQVVKVAYLVMMKPGTGTGSSGSSGSSSSSSSSSSATTEEQQQQQQQEREQDQAAAAAPEAFASAAGSRSRQEQYSLFDPATNKTVVWSRYTSVDCAQDRYILLPLAQLHSDMKMVPELLDADAAGVNITMSEAALALSGPGNGSSSGSNSSGSSSGSLYNADSSVRNPTGGLSGNKAGAGGHAAAAAAAAVDGGEGYGGLGKRNIGVWCGSSSSGRNQPGTAGSVLGSGVSLGASNHSNSKDSSSKDVGSSGTNRTAGSSSSNACGMQLPGVNAELPIILTADEGRSSKTYTLLLYSNESAAAAVRSLVLPQEAAAAASAARTAAAAAAGSSSPAEDAASFSAAYFASRPEDWPRSPAQSGKCSVCPNGTYSTRIDAYECKVCPPGKYAGSPFSTSCLFCPPGTFSYYWGAPACRTCLPGTYAADAGSLFCDICRDGTTTYSEGATSCDVSVTDDGSVVADSLNASDYAILLSFGVVLDGTLLEAVTRSTTGINGSSEGIVAVLVRSDTASALNVSLGSVQVLGVQQLDSRQLLVNVSATVPVPTEEAGAAAATEQDLSADALIQRLIDDPNTFLRTTQTLGAESASVQDVTTHRTRRSRLGYTGKLHALLWPTLLGSLLLLAALVCMWWKWRKRRRVRATELALSGLDFATAATAVGGLAGGLVGSGHALAGFSSSDGSSVGSSAAGGGGFSGRASSWRRGWQRFWASDVRVVLRSGGFGGHGSASPSSSGSGSSSPGSSHSGSDGLCVTVAVGECGAGGVPLNEESFTARLRAKQLGTAGMALNCRHQHPGNW